MKIFWTIDIVLLYALLQSCNPAPSGKQKNTEHKRNKQTTKIDSSAIRSRINDYNTQFVVDAAHASWAKHFLGRLAYDKGSSAVVRKLGQTMIKDHSIENKMLIALATSEKIRTMPRVMGSEEQRFLDSLALKKGSLFDRAYVNYLIEMYQKEIMYFEEANQKLTNPDILAFANAILPMLRKHLIECEEVREQL